MTTPAVRLDHVAVGTRQLSDGWDLFAGLLGGSFAYGGDSPGFWWGQLDFRSGPKIEMLTPTGADGAFLERFLAGRGPGPHHLNFIVTDISDTLARIRAAGIEPVGVSLAGPRWKEAFLRPRDAHGIVIQVAEQSAYPPVPPVPAELPASGPACDFTLVEHHVTDLDAAVTLFMAGLGGTLAEGATTAGAAELTWPGGGRLRLVGDGGADTARTRLHFRRAGTGFTAAERGQIAGLSGRLGVSLELAG